MGTQPSLVLFSGAAQRAFAALLVVALLLASPCLVSSQDTPSDIADEPTADATTQTAAEEAKPATPPGQKSLDDYKAMLRQLSASRKYEDVIKLTDEIEQIYPNDENVNFYRTRAEKSLEIEATREKIKKRVNTETGGATEDTATAPPVPAATPDTTPVPRKTQPPVSPPPPIPPPVIVQSSSGSLLSKLKPVIAGVLITGAAVLLAIGGMSLKRKKSAAPTLPPLQEEADFGQEGYPPADAFQQASFQRQPSSPPPSWDADPMRSASSSAIDEDLFSPSGGGSKEDSGFGADIFSEPTAPRSTKTASHVEDTADQSTGFSFLDNPPKPSVQATRAAASEEPVSFDFDSVPTPSARVSEPGTKASSKPQVAPWSGAEELESFPMLKMDSSASSPPPTASAQPTAKAESKAPWESRSETATANKSKQESFKLPPEDESLPALDLGGATAASASTKTKTGPRPMPPGPDMPGFGEKPGAPSFAEMNLNAIKSPEFSETVVDLDISKAADTNPGFDIQPSTPKAPPPPNLDLPQMPGDFGESTVVLSKTELSDDPDLFLQGTHFGKVRPKQPAEPQAPPERFKEFKADETIGISFGGETTPPPKADKPAESGKPKDSFERERDMGLQAFKDAEWDKAVYHLSIAAALRPEATDVKEQLRRARRMRKEKESGSAG